MLWWGRPVLQNCFVHALVNEIICACLQIVSKATSINGSSAETDFTGTWIKVCITNVLESCKLISLQLIQYLHTMP